MKPDLLPVECRFTPDGPTAQDAILELFSEYLRRQAPEQKEASDAD